MYPPQTPWTGIGSLQSARLHSEISTLRGEANSRSSYVGRLEYTLGETSTILTALESRLQEVEENYVRRST